MVVSELDRDCVTVERWTNYQNNNNVSTQGQNCNSYDLSSLCTVLSGLETVGGISIKFVSNAVLKATLGLSTVIAAGCALSEIASLVFDCDWNNFLLCVDDTSCSFVGNELICNPFPPFVTVKPIC